MGHGILAEILAAARTWAIICHTCGRTRMCATEAGAIVTRDCHRQAAARRGRPHLVTIERTGES